MRGCIAVLASVVFLSTACGGGGAGGAAAGPAGGAAAGSGGGAVSGSGTQTVTASGGSSSRSSSSAAASVAAGSSSSFNTGVVWTPAAPAPGQVTTFSPDSTIAANSVVTFGQTFSQGEMPSAVTATYGGSNLPTQTDVKRTHPDGSIRHAVISVRLPAITAAAPAQASIAFALSAGSNATGSPLSLASVNGAGSPVDYRVEIIEHGVKADGTPTTESGKTWTTTLKSALSGTVEQWMSGALVSEWRARVAPTANGSAHPGLRVIFDARYQSTTQGRVSIAIENVESTPARGDRTYDLRIYNATTGGTLVHTRDNLLHYSHTRLRKVLYFGAGVKDMLTVVDVARLKASRTIPNYANVTIPAGELSNRYTAWQNSQRDLFQESLIHSYMPATGGREDIGPLPGWTARAMISGDPRMYQAMLDQAERAAYFNVHWRDSLRAGATVANADVFSIDVHPKFALFNPSSSTNSYVGDAGYNREGDFLAPPIQPITVPSGGFSPDRSHQPSLAFVPYVVTGDHYYLDELNFWAAWNLIGMAYDYRDEAKGLFKAESQTRGQAWSLRTTGHAAWIAPSGSPHATYFANKLQENLIWYRANILNSNALGYWKWGDIGINRSEMPFASVQASKAFSPWQHHFVAYTLYELCAKGFAATDLRDFTLGYTVKLFTSPDFDPLDATSYRLVTETANGQPIQTMADLSYHSFSGLSFTVRHPGWSLTLPQAGDPDGYVSIAMGALAAAVDSASGSNAVQSAAYVYVRNETMAQGNGSRAGFLSNPTWNIVPFGTVVGLTEAPGIYTK